MNLTDNEIIKALECCGVNCDCAGCPKEKEPYGCYFELCGGAFDLINRQKAEIERLNSSIMAGAEVVRTVEQELKTAKSKVIKEFAERLKAEFEPDPNYEKAVNFTIKLFRNFIDNLVKELVGE